MIGELHDAARPQEVKQYDLHMVQAGHTMQAALAWLGLYYVILRPCKVIPTPSNNALKTYDESGLQPRFSFILASWREYENMQ